MSTIPSCPARTDADSGAIGQTLPHRARVASPVLGPLLSQPEPHHCPWDTPISPQAAQVMVVPRGSTGLPLHPSPRAQPPNASWSSLCPASIQRGLMALSRVGQDIVRPRKGGCAALLDPASPGTAGSGSSP